MSQFLQFVVSGAVAGALYALLASGLALTYSTSGVFNFAHGAIAFVTALLYYQLNSGLGWPIVPAAVVAIGVFAPLVGLVLDRLMFRGLARAGSTAQIVATVGLMIALPAAAVFLVERANTLLGWDLPGVGNVVTPPGVGPSPAHVYTLFGNVTIDTNQIATLVAALLAAVGLGLLVRGTSLGLRLRASVDRRDLASLRGVDPDRSSTIAWMLGTLLAGAAGVLGAPILALGAYPFTLVMLISATAAVFGRLRSVPVAFAGGLALGVIQTLTAGYVDPRIDLEGLSSSLPYILLFGGLLLLLRDRGGAARLVAQDDAPPLRVSTRPPWRRAAPWVVATAVLVVYVQVLADALWVGLVVSGLCLSLVFLSFVVVTGLGGMVSLAQAAFVTAAALTAGYLVDSGVPFIGALVAGILVAMALGAIVALPALRLGGVALALATLAMAFIGDLMVFRIDAVRNENLGWTIPRPIVGPLDFRDDRAMALLLLVVVAAVALLIRNLQRSPSGRAVLAVRSSLPAAATSGVSAVRVKLGLFVLASGIAGLGGVLYASYNGSATQLDFPPLVGAIWLAVAVTFGVRRPGYAIVAGLVFAAAPTVIGWFTDSTVVPQILFGIGGIGLARNPDGFLSDTATRVDDLVRRWRGRSVRADTMLVSPDGQVLDPVATPAAEPSPLRIPAGSAEDEPDRAPALLELVDVRAGYEGVEVLHGIDLAVAAGTLVTLLGPNGAGKSTLCAVAGGLLAPTGGSVHLDGEDVTRLPAHRRAGRGLQLAPETRGIFPGLTVEENLRLVLTSAELRSHVYDRFPQLDARRDQAAGVLSGGEQQILALAPLLVQPPRVLVVDEPTLGLAPQVVAQVLALLVELRAAGTGVLVVEEKAHDVLDVADQLVIIERGRVVWAGRPDDTTATRLADTYLGAAPALTTQIDTGGLVAGADKPRASARDDQGGGS